MMRSSSCPTPLGLLRSLSLLLMVTIGMSFSRVQAQQFIPDPALKKYILKQMKTAQVPGVSLALVDRRGIIWAEGFGMADVAQAKKASPRTIYRTASLTKLFTGLAVMQLFEADLCDLDDPIQRYIPELKLRSRFPYTDSITIRQVLTHHSGLPSDVMYRYFHPDPPPFQSAISFLNQEYLSFPSNTILSYSNVGYSILGVLIERLSGMTYETYIRRYILTPLAMKQSDFQVRPDMRGRYATGYEGNNTPFLEPPARDLPAMMLHSSVADLAHFMQMILLRGSFRDQQLLTPAGVAEMLRPQNEDISLDFDERIGLSFFLTGEDGMWGYAGGSAEHSGDTFVYHAQMTLLPKVGLGVVVLTNGEEGNWVAYAAARSVLQAALFQLRDRSPQPVFQPKIKKRKVAKAQLLPLAGTYFFGAQPVKVYAKRGRMEAHYDGIKLHLIPTHRGGYFPRVRKFGFPVNDKSQRFRFERVGKRQVMTLTYANETELLGVRIPEAPIPLAWHNRLGDYIPLEEDSLDMLGHARLDLEEGMLFLKIFLRNGKEAGRQAIRPLNDTTAIVYGIGRSTGNTIYIRQAEGQETLRFEGTEWVRNSMRRTHTGKVP